MGQNPSNNLEMDRYQIKSHQNSKPSITKENAKMKTIWKFPLEIKDYQEIHIPSAHRILAIQTQNEQPCIWALVESDSPQEKVPIYIVGTGHDAKTVVNLEANYIGTFQIQGGAFVFHVFKRP